MKHISPLSKKLLSQYNKNSLIVMGKLSEGSNTSKTTTEGDEIGDNSPQHSSIQPGFIREFLSHLGLSAFFILLGLVVGLLGYHWTNNLSWVDALVEASMILSGMGPINSLSTTSAKVFASAYALFSGLIFVLAMGVVLSPLVSSLLKQLSYFSARNEQKKKSNSTEQVPYPNQDT